MLCVWVGGAAALLPVSPALAHAGATGSAGSGAAASSGADGSDSGASSGGKSGGGGGGGIKSALCNAVNSTPIGGVLGGLTGLTSNCNSGGGSVDPVQAMSSILKATFAAGGVAAPILAPALAEIPDYGASSRAGGAAWLESYVRAMAFAVLGLIVTLSAFRFWIAGVAGQGAFAAAHALVRAVGAVLLIAVWPFVFNNLAAVLNVATHALLDQHVVQVSMFAMGGFNAAALAVLFGVAKIPKVGQVGWIFGILLFGLQAITVVGLLLLKVALAVSTTVIFVSMPLLLALWVLPELGWLAERAMRVLFVALCTPVIWALLFATAAVMSANLFGGSGFVDKLFLHPLATIAMFVLALLIPLMLLRHTHGGYGRQPMGMLAGYAGLRLAAGAVSMHIPTQLGGRKQAPSGVQTVLTRDRDGRTSVLERLSVNPADPAGRRAALRFADGRMAGQGELVDLLGGTDDATLTSTVNGSGGPDRGGSAGRAGGAELRALSPEDARRVPAAQRALAGARRATPTIDRVEPRSPRSPGTPVVRSPLTIASTATSTRRSRWRTTRCATSSVSSAGKRSGRWPGCPSRSCSTCSARRRRRRITRSRNGWPTSSVPTGFSPPRPPRRTRRGGRSPRRRRHPRPGAWPARAPRRTTPTRGLTSRHRG